MLPKCLNFPGCICTSYQVVTLTEVLTLTVKYLHLQLSICILNPVFTIPTMSFALLAKCFHFQNSFVTPSLVLTLIA